MFIFRDIVASSGEVAVLIAQVLMLIINFIMGKAGAKNEINKFIDNNK